MESRAGAIATLVAIALATVACSSHARAPSTSAGVATTSESATTTRGLTPYSPVIATLQSAMTTTTEVATLRLVIARERAYDVQVLDDGSEVRLRRRA